MKNLVILLTFIMLLSSCVSTKKFDEQKARSEKYLAQKKDCQESLKLTEGQLEDANSKIKNLNTENKNLTENLKSLKKASKSLTQLAEEEKALKEQANKNYEDYMLSSSEKQEALTQELAEKARALNKKESDLLAMQSSLEERESQLKDIKNEIFGKETEIAISSERIKDLESKLNAQSEATTELKNTITKALKEFTSEELTVEEKEGKIHVSLSEKLLFKPGSFTLDNIGASAISKLAEVLEKQKDLDIIVEGHTDSDPFGGKGELLDNLDLSTKRATSVVRVLVKNGVSKEKITAAGRGDTKPVAENTSKEGKAKNRRTEIILAPDLEKLFQLIQTK